MANIDVSIEKAIRNLVLSAENFGDETGDHIPKINRCVVQPGEERSIKIKKPQQEPSGSDDNKNLQEEIADRTKQDKAHRKGQKKKEDGDNIG